MLAKAGDRVVRVDCHFPAADVVVELLGYRFHRTRTQMNRDAERHNALLAAGKRVYQFTYDQVTSTGSDVVHQTARALGILPPTALTPPVPRFWWRDRDRGGPDRASRRNGACTRVLSAG